MLEKTMLSPSWDCHPVGDVDFGRIHPSVLGSQKEKWDRGRYHDAMNVEIHSFENCRMAARGLVFDCSGEIVAQSIGVHHEAESTAKLVRELDEPHVYLAGEHFLLKRPGASCYGHWIIEILPNLGIYQSSIGSPAKVIVQKLDGKMRQIQFETLGIMGIEPEAIVETRTAVYQIDKLDAVFGAAETLQTFSPLILETFSRIANTVPRGNHKKIYLERNPLGTRAVFNSEEVRTFLEDLGFFAVRLEDYSFLEQVSLMRGAEIVIGITGSALTNVVFCDPGTKVLTIAPDVISDDFYWKLCNLCGVEYHEVRYPKQAVGTQRLTHDYPVKVDVLHLSRAISRL